MLQQEDPREAARRRTVMKVCGVIIGVALLATLVAMALFMRSIQQIGAFTLPLIFITLFTAVGGAIALDGPDEY